MVPKNSKIPKMIKLNEKELLFCKTCIETGRNNIKEMCKYFNVCNTYLYYHGIRKDLKFKNKI